MARPPDHAPRTGPASPTVVRVIAVDGPACSGKTTYAAALASTLSDTLSVVVVHMDDVYRGWDGLAEVEPEVRRILSSLRNGQAVRYQPWDWNLACPDTEQEISPADVVILEGVGSGCAVELVDELVWCDADADTRRTRGWERDGATLGARWDQWAEAEAVHFARYDTRARADVEAES